MKRLREAIERARAHAEKALAKDSIQKMSNKRKTHPNVPITWGRSHDNRQFWETPTPVDVIPAGIYVARACQQRGCYLEARDTKSDSLVPVEDETLNALQAEAQAFWNAAEGYAKYGLLHKRGYLLWGVPGGGKTSLMHLITEEFLTKQQGIVILVQNPRMVESCMHMVRRLEPKRPMLIIMEDLDDLAEEGEIELLALLDGASQVDHVLFLATSNYPEKLDARFTNRPSRLDRVVQIELPGPNQRMHFLMDRDPGLSEEEAATWAKATKGLTLAHLRELIVAVRVLGHPFQETVERLHKMDAGERPHSKNEKSREEPEPLGLIPRRA